MHSRGFAHLDLKHENILLDDTNQPKIANFRFTRHTNGQLVYLRQSTKDNGAPEALEYLAPLDGMRVDIYACSIRVPQAQDIQIDKRFKQAKKEDMNQQVTRLLKITMSTQVE